MEDTNIKRDKKISNKKYLLCTLIILIISIVFIFFTFLIKPDIEEVKDSVVMIKAFDEDGSLISTGSGFCAYKDNYIITNFHVIQGAKTIKVINDDKQEYNVNKIEIIKSGDDLAILSGNYSFSPLKIDTSPLKAGQSVICIGSPEGQLNTVSTGIVSNADDDFEIRITAPISPGSSGGVLLNANHKVIGITYASYNSLEAQNINYAINVKYLEEMYKNLLGGECFSLPNNVDYTPYTLNTITKSNTLDIYYYVDSLDTFYNATSNKKKFENLLQKKAPTWYNIFNSCSNIQKYECISILEDFSAKNASSIELLEQAVKDYSFEEIAYKIAVEKYQYAITLAKMSTLKSSDDIISLINSLPIKDGQKILLKYCFVYQNITQFTDTENKKLIKYLNEKYNSRAAVSLLEKMGYTLEKNGNTYTIYWD